MYLRNKEKFTVAGALVQGVGAGRSKHSLTMTGLVRFATLTEKLGTQSEIIKSWMTGPGLYNKEAKIHIIL